MTVQPNIDETDDSEDAPGEPGEDGRIYIGSSECRQTFAEVLSRVEYQNERYVVQRHDKPAAALVPLDVLREIEALEDAADRAALEEVEEDEETISLEEVEKTLSSDE